MSPKKRKDVAGSTDWFWSLKGGTALYLLVQGQYRVFMPAYIEKAYIWLLYWLFGIFGYRSLTDSLTVNKIPSEMEVAPRCNC